MGVRDDSFPTWVLWLIVVFGTVQPIAWVLAGRPIEIVPELIAWGSLIAFASLAMYRISSQRERLARSEAAHLAARAAADGLTLQNEMLQIVASTGDVPQAFHSLASRIARIVPSERVGLALLSEDGQELQTYTTRVEPAERRARPRPEVVFRMEGSALGHVVRTREPLLIPDVSQVASDYLDANVLASAGFRSALLVPLLSKGRAVGTLNMVSRQRGAFSLDQVRPIQPVAEILAIAWLTQQLQVALGHHRTMEAIGEVTLATAAEINSALQAIIGHCDLIEREYTDTRLHRDLDTVVRQAQRIAGLLETMRQTALRRSGIADDPLP
jgi:GAF domain-containing protein